MSPSAALTTRGHAPAKASDRTLMGQIADGDAAAFDELYRRHSRAVLMHARKLCASRELAEEVTQETFISLWRSAHRYRPALGSVSAWLSGIVRNRAIDAWRRTAARPPEVPSCEHGAAQLHGLVGADTQDPERAHALSLIAKLPPAQKEAIFLAYFGGMTHDEIATWAAAPLGTVKGRIRLGLEKLRWEVEEQRGTPRAQPAIPRTPSQPPLRAVPAPVAALAPPARRRRAGAVHAPRRGPGCPRPDGHRALTSAA